MIKKFFLALAAIIALTQCAGPTTQRPYYDPQSVNYERQQQLENANQQGSKTNEDDDQNINKKDINYLRGVKQDQLRAWYLTFPILRAGLPFCTKQSPALGMITRSLEDFKNAEDKRLAAQLWSLPSQGIAMIYVHPDSPAYAAGLRQNDVIYSVNDQNVSNSQNYNKVLQKALAASKNGTPVKIGYARGIEKFNGYVTPVPICDYPIIVVDKNEVNAFADGEKLYVFRGLMKHFQDDDQLAFVIAHELAHNAMGHVDAQKKNVLAGGVLGTLLDIAIGSTTGYSTNGQLGKLGANIGNLTYSQDFEHEADYVGLYIMARSPFNYKEAPLVARKLGEATPKSITYASTHPTTPERFVSLEAALREIEAKKKNNQPLIPTLKPKE